MVTIDFNSFIIMCNYSILSYVGFCKFLRNSVFGLLHDLHVEILNKFIYLSATVIVFPCHHLVFRNTGLLTLFYDYFAEMQNRS